MTESRKSKFHDVFQWRSPFSIWASRIWQARHKSLPSSLATRAWTCGGILCPQESQVANPVFLHTSMVSRAPEVAPRGARLDKFGLWRSLASALAWGARGPGFKSRQPDQIPQRLTASRPSQTPSVESNWSPKWTPLLGRPGAGSSSSNFLRPLYSCRNPTFPTNASEVVDYAMATLVGYAYFSDMQPDKEPDKTSHRIPRCNWCN